VAAAAGLLATASTASATPSTVFWTPATTYVQPYLVPHVTYDTYFSEGGILQNTYGLTVGVLPFPKVQAEFGVDVLYPSLINPATGTRTTSVDNLYLNGKLGLPEGAFAKWQPGISAGVQSVGFKKDYSDYGHTHAEIGKTFPYVGNFTAGGYYGINSTLYVSSSGKTERAGGMISWTSPDIKIGLTGLDKIAFMADWASGSNLFGAGGVAVGFYFTPAIDILTGPVWFNDPALFRATYGAGLGDFVWSVQLDVDFDLRRPPKKT
jgi:hypothetical protein